MAYVYAAMLIHKAGGKIDEHSVKKVLEAANVKVDDARVKALVAALDGVNIEEAIEKAAFVAAPVAAAAPAEWTCRLPTVRPRPSCRRTALRRRRPSAPRATRDGSGSGRR